MRSSLGRKALVLLMIAGLLTAVFGATGASAAAGDIDTVCFDKPGDPYYRAFVGDDGECDDPTGDPDTHFAVNFNDGDQVRVSYQWGDQAMKYYTSFWWVTRGQLLNGDGSVTVCVYEYSRYTSQGWSDVAPWIHRYDGSCSGGYSATI